MALQRLVCVSCDAKIPSRAYCPQCGTPTKLATAQQRILWEMGQIQDGRTQVVPEKPARLTLQPQQAAVGRPDVTARTDAYDARMVVGSSAMAIPMEELDLRHTPPPPPPPAAGGSGSDGAGPAPTGRGPSVSGRIPLPRSARLRPGASEPVAHEQPQVGAPTREADASNDDHDVRTSDTSGAERTEELRRATPARPSPTRRVAPSPPTGRRIPVPAKRPDPPRAPRERPGSDHTNAPAAPEPPPTAFKPPAVTDGRTLVIKRRQASPSTEPAPDPFETATILREISERSAEVPSRRDRRRQRKREHEQAAKARAQAERARKEAEKLAKRQAKAVRKNKAAEPADLPDPASIEVPEGPPKLGWKERKALKLLDAIGGVPGEEVVQMHDGRSRLRSATLLITNYRVAVVGRGARRHVIGWIPLEEIERMKMVWRGAETLHVEGSFERLSFQAAASGALREAESMLRRAVKEARAPGTDRHSADVIQAWCERTAEVWENGANRMRLWIRKHPAATLIGLSSLVPAAYVLSSRL